MKLMMVARRYPPDVRSGTETVFRNLVERARARHDVQLVVGYRRGREFVPPDAVAVDLRGVKRADAWRKLWWATVQAKRRFKPDAVLSNSIEVPSVGAPTACIVHDLNFGGGRRDLGVRARELFYRTKGKRLDAIVTVSQASRRRLVEVGLDPERITVVHNGVDLAAFTPKPSAQDGVFRFAYPSRILPGKGQHVAIDAIARLRKRDKKRVHLDIVGAVDDPVFLDQLRVQAYQQPVAFHTDVPDIAPYYRDADAILFPTLMQEGFGFTAIEGMACGKPVIWSEQPAIREATGGIGLSFPEGRVEALRDAMVQLLNDPARARALGEDGRAYVAQHYDWGQVWLRYEAVLAGLCA